LNQWRIRPKLVAVVIGPTVVAVLLALWSAAGTWGTLEGYRQSVALLKLDSQVDALGDAVQTERDLSTIYVADNRTSGAAQLSTARQTTDTALVAYQNGVAGLDTAGASDLATIVTAITNQMQGLAFVRGAVDNAGLTQGAIVGSYNDMISALADLVSYVPGANSQVAAQVGVLATFFELKESTGQVRSELAAILTSGSFKVGDLQTLTDLLGQQQSLLDSFLTSGSQAQRAEYSTAVQGQAAAQVQTIEDDSVQAATAPTLPDTSQAWFNAATDLMGQLNTVQNEILAGAVADVDNLYGSSIETFAIVLLVLLFTVGLAVWVSFRVARSISTQLKQLGTSATQVATEWLPEVMHRLRQVAVDPFADFTIAGQLVRTPGEIGEVADALNEVSGACLELARQQADLRANTTEAFANLATRNQRYVSAILRNLDDWERDEPDPDVMGRLYVLDQLATRMRRTVNSLFVIAGVQSADVRREPMTVDDVVRAAVSEIEMYKKVGRPHTAGQAWIVGWAVVDLVHLLAELFDNATRATPATGSDGAVDLVFRPVPDGMLIMIGDHGIGMHAEDLDRANQLMSLQATEPVVSSMRTMGLHVVARLAAKHKVTVQFRAQPAPQRGVIVAVHLPATIVLGAQGNQAIDGHHAPVVVSAAVEGPAPPARAPGPPVAAIGAAGTCRTPQSPPRTPLRTAANGDVDPAEADLLDDEDAPRHAGLRTYTREELHVLRNRLGLGLRAASRDDDPADTRPHQVGTP
jgi:hypothetical protein